MQGIFFSFLNRKLDTFKHTTFQAYYLQYGKIFIAWTGLKHNGTKQSIDKTGVCH